jgi:MFS family permease
MDYGPDGLCQSVKLLLTVTFQIVMANQTYGTGRISDTFGRKGPFLFSLLAFGLGTTWCALAPSIVHFIMARAVCGLGAGGAMSLGQIINSDLVPLERRSSYLALLNLAYGTGSSLGAALGGFLADVLGWRWEFGIQVPAIALCFVIACFTTPTGLGPNFAKHSNNSLWQQVKGFDLAGSFLLTSSVTFLVLALNLGGNILPWDHLFIISAFVLFGVLGVVLIFVERHAPKPVLPLHLLFNVPRGNLIISNFFACMSMNTILFNIPLYFQATLLDTPTRSGTRLIVPFLCNMAAAFITGNLITYTRRLSPTMVLGYALIVLGSIFLTTMSRTLPTWLYSWLIATATMGQGCSFPTVSIAILAVTHAHDMAVATSTLILFRSLGTVMGVAVSSLVSQNALVYYLEKFVTGKDKDAVIGEARRSVEAIVKLSPFNREQGKLPIYVGLRELLIWSTVIDAYAAAMKVTFAQCIATAVIALLLVLFIHLPRLNNQTVVVDVQE